MKKPTTLDPIAILKAEIEDFQRQITEAQNQAGFWQQKLLMANGALQACQALLKKLETTDETPDP
jgi:hypothetical protein